MKEFIMNVFEDVCVTKEKECACMLSQDEKECLIGGEDDIVTRENKGLRSGTEHFHYAVMVEGDITDSNGVPYSDYHREDGQISVFYLSSGAVNKINELEALYPDKKYFMVVVGSYWREVPKGYKMPSY
jgi:hypothetical protein